MRSALVPIAVAAALLAVALAVRVRSLDRAEVRPLAPARPAERSAAAPDGDVAAPRGDGGAEPDRAAAAPDEPAQPPPETPPLLDEDAREALATPVPDGRIEGVVMRGAEPVGGAEVHVWPLDDRTRDVRDVDAIGAWTARTDVRGEFAFDVDPSVVHRVEARLPDARLATIVVPRANRNNRRVVLYFGAASIAGTVTDLAGAPRPGVLVQASLGGTSTGGSGRHAQAWTDAAGAFALRGLSEGYWRLRRFDDGVDDGVEDGIAAVELGATDAAALDFRVAEPED